MKYLLEIHHGIGDIVQYTGLIKSIKNYDKDAFIGLVLNKDAYKSLFTMDKNVDVIYIVDFSGSRFKLLKTIHQIRCTHFDYMVCSIHSGQKSMEFMAVSFGARKVVGSNLFRIGKFSKRYINILIDNKEHVVKQNYQVLHGLNSDFELFEPYLICPEPPYKLNKHSIGLCIGTSISQKTWLLDRYIAVGEYFENLGYSIVLLGGKKEQKAFEEYGYNNGRWLDILGKTDLIESASESAECDLIIGGDTGLMHMAAAVGIKTLTLFSCSEPTRHAPYSKASYYYYVPMSCQFCFGTQEMRKCRNYKCLTNIETEKIIEIADGILKGRQDVEQYRLQI